MSSPARKSDSQFAFYATLLDAFESYLESDQLYQKFYGNSEEPKFTEDEWADKQFVELINRINRVPFTNDAVEKGTAFNNIVDMMLDGKYDDGLHVLSIDEEKNQITIAERSVSKDDKGKEKTEFLNARTFLYSVAKEFADYYEGGLKQYFTIGTIDTCYGNVDVYGFIDYLLPFSIHDMKTTSRYSAGSYKTHWQHIVYPFAMKQQGMDIPRFEYNVTNFKETFTEVYVFDEQRDVPRLRAMCERFINFLLANKHLITDKKVFNYREI